MAKIKDKDRLLYRPTNNELRNHVPPTDLKSAAGLHKLMEIYRETIKKSNAARIEPNKQGKHVVYKILADKLPPLDKNKPRTQMTQDEVWDALGVEDEFRNESNAVEPEFDPPYFLGAPKEDFPVVSHEALQDFVDAHPPRAYAQV